MMLKQAQAVYAPPRGFLLLNYSPKQQAVQRKCLCRILHLLCAKIIFILYIRWFQPQRHKQMKMLHGAIEEPFFV